MVTHDPDIASYANRTLHFKDGTLQKDEATAHPRDAQQDVERLSAEPAEAGAPS